MIRTALIVAGGKGLRMGSELPKQFLLMAAKPVLMHTLEAFHRYDEAMQLIVVLPREQQSYWKQLCSDYHFTLNHLIADGGETRFHSVQNGLMLVQEPGLVAVHDGVRPFVSQEVIARCYEAAETQLAAIPVIDVFETVRHLTPQGSETVNRDDYKLVQTPQVFEVGLLKNAYSQAYSTHFTDDASVVEALGVSITLVEGNRENIKITTPFDLKVGSALLACLI
ncbi:2-C-methyl-D-erythritol 4-phosphate cytidylyltransferase [Bacteroides sp.]|uniref:2-C-methyl-D-erythritol 4-phosphate cytidylyltransferase n=1 Tax=Bacteroides sp. TaxID=29523 RepID=UPI002FC77CB7